MPVGLHPSAERSAQGPHLCDAPGRTGIPCRGLIDRRGRFHAQPEATEIMYETYPTTIRDWIRRHGGLTPHLLLLRGRDLASFYRVCR
jgi:hypothetical protein